MSLAVQRDQLGGQGDTGDQERSEEEELPPSVFRLVIAGRILNCRLDDQAHDAGDDDGCRNPPPDPPASHTRPSKTPM
jgi:hypothetical protein